MARKESAWQKHVRATMKSNKGKKFGDILKIAKKSYHKK